MSSGEAHHGVLTKSPWAFPIKYVLDDSREQEAGATEELPASYIGENVPKPQRCLIHMCGPHICLVPIQYLHKRPSPIYTGSKPLGEAVIRM
jgi:hypothetical protein